MISRSPDIEIARPDAPEQARAGASFESLREAELKYRSIFENAIHGIYQSVNEGRFVNVNPALARMLGYDSPADMIACCADIARHYYVQTDGREAFLALITERGLLQGYEVQVRRKDGVAIWTRENVYAVRDAHGQLLYYEGSVEDITAHKQAEVALRESEERYRDLFENANDIIYTADLAGNYTSVNKVGEAVTGYSRAELCRLNFTHLVAPEHLARTHEMLAHKFTGQETTTVYELEIVAKDGRRVSLEISTRLLFAAGQPVGVQGIARDITERKQVEERLRQHALADALTGLPNRLLFTDHLKLAVEQARRQPAQRFAVLFLDLDRFKMINDSLGHGVGDQLLIAIARQLESCLRASDTVARLGGDEFAILLNDISDFDDAIRVAERVLHELKQPFKLAGHEVFTSASIGIALSNNRYQAAADVLRDADTAMYRAKAEGKARYEVFDMVMHARVVALLQLENDLRRAIEREEFSIYYQPIVALADGRITGFEALVRWPHPERGLVRPAEFIPVAEETGLIVPLGRWVLRAACAQMRLWQAISPAHARLKLNVNLSGRQFTQTDLCGHIEHTLAVTNFEPHCLQLEITESVVMENAQTIVPMLARLRALGVELAIDDFGTGYSSLSYLRRFPIQTLKIDRSFISGGAEEDAEIVRTIVLLARNMGKDVVAEGIETPAQLAQLRALDCAYGQGYLFSAPQDAAATERMLRHALDRDLRMLPASDECVA